MYTDPRVPLGLIISLRRVHTSLPMLLWSQTISFQYIHNVNRHNPSILNHTLIWIGLHNSLFAISHVVYISTLKQQCRPLETACISPLTKYTQAHMEIRCAFTLTSLHGRRQIDYLMSVWTFWSLHGVSLHGVLYLSWPRGNYRLYVLLSSLELFCLSSPWLSHYSPAKQMGCIRNK